LKHRNISVLLIEESWNGVRQFSVQTSFLVVILTSLLVVGSALGWIVYDYRSLKPRMRELSKAETLSLHRKAEIAYLRQRIRVIRQKLEELDVYDKKLRTVAHIATGHEGESLVGVGGSDSRASGTGEIKSESRQKTSPVGLRDNGEGNISKQKKGAFLDFIKTWTPILPTASASRPGRGWICAEFGSRVVPFNGSREFHKGVDIATRSNAQILAPADGMVIAVDWHKDYGRRVVVSHGFGVVSIFAHLDRVFVARGERLGQGEPIALAGGTRGSAGSYVHYELHFYGVPVNPRQYMLPSLQ
jgi:murein DD-endopeptidase MepM/ murein hydrolase activator NlpD